MTKCAIKCSLLLVLQSLMLIASLSRSQFSSSLLLNLMSHNLPSRCGAVPLQVFAHRRQYRTSIASGHCAVRYSWSFHLVILVVLLLLCYTILVGCTLLLHLLMHCSSTNSTRLVNGHGVSRIVHWLCWTIVVETFLDALKVSEAYARQMRRTEETCKVQWLNTKQHFFTFFSSLYKHVQCAEKS